MKMNGNQSDDDDGEIWATPKALSGAGDGLKVSKTNSKMNNRQMVQKRDEKIKKKLEDDMRERKFGKSRLKKASTVAEITPTKSHTVKRLNVKSCTNVNDKCTLHATPRPLTDGDKNAAVAANNTKILRRPCGREWAVCTVYQRLLLCVWRRSKQELIMSNESSRRHMDQISQLQLQINVLKELCKSEAMKRKRALNDYNMTEMKYDTLLKRNLQMMQDMKELQFKLDSNENELDSTKTQLNMVNSQLNETQLQLNGKMEEFSIASNQLLIYEADLKKINEKNRELLEKLMEIEQIHEDLTFVHNEQDLLQIHLQEEIKTKDILNEQLKEDIKTLQQTQIGLKQEIFNLETEIQLFRKFRTLWKNFQQISVTCICILDKFAHLLLPAYK